MYVGHFDAGRCGGEDCREALSLCWLMRMLLLMFQSVFQIFVDEDTAIRMPVQMKPRNGEGCKQDTKIIHRVGKVERSAAAELVVEEGKDVDEGTEVAGLPAVRCRGGGAMGGRGGRRVGIGGLCVCGCLGGMNTDTNTDTDTGAGVRRLSFPPCWMRSRVLGMVLVFRCLLLFHF